MHRLLALSLLLVDAPAQAQPLFESRPLDTQVGLSYRVRGISLSQGSEQLTGSVDNELMGHGRYRVGPWLFGLSAWRYRTPLEVSELPSEQNPVATPEATDLRLAAGYVLGNTTWEIAPSLGVMQLNVTPNNAGVPYTGTLMDFKHARRGLGLSVPASWAIATGWELFGEATYFPSVAISLDRTPYGLMPANYAEARIGVGYHPMPAMRMDLTYTHGRWRGPFASDADVWGLGLTYRPTREEDAR